MVIEAHAMKPTIAMTFQDLFDRTQIPIKDIIPPAPIDKIDMAAWTWPWMSTVVVVPLVVPFAAAVSIGLTKLSVGKVLMNGTYFSEKFRFRN